MATLKGIDISAWQERVNFKQVKQAGVNFLIFREGYRQTTDGRFFEYVTNAKAAGIPIVGVYHFSYALNADQARKEAQFCIANVEKAGLGKDTIIFFDFEYDTVKKAAENGVKLGREQCIAHTKAFCEEVTAHGYKAGVYSNIDYYKNMYDKNILSKYVFWLADYTGSPDYPCEFHQYSSKGYVSGINGNVDMDYWYTDKAVENPSTGARSRQAVVDLANSWLGKNEADGSYKVIIDLYNSYKGPFPRGTKMEYGWAWCAAMWSAIAIALEYTDIMPIEISCYYLVEEAKEMGCWVENDMYVPSPGDAILYDWEDTGTGDNQGVPDHIGVVDSVSDGYILAIEGNYNDSVKKRMIPLNGKNIRGFITPKYDAGTVSGPTQTPNKDINDLAKEVIAGLWGNGETRIAALTHAGYDYTKVQARVNEILNGTAEKPQPENVLRKVTASTYAKGFNRTIAGVYQVNTSNGLYLRDGAGTNKKALCIIPHSTKVNCYGYYTKHSGVDWYLIQFVMNGTQYTGFSSSSYLTKL